MSNELKQWYVGDFAVYTPDGFIPYSTYNTEQVTVIVKENIASSERIEELTIREAKLTAENEELKGQNERLERKKDDYPNVLAKIFNDLEFVRKTAMEREAKLVAENKVLVIAKNEALSQISEREMNLRSEVQLRLDEAAKREAKLIDCVQKSLYWINRRPNCYDEDVRMLNDRNFIKITLSELNIKEGI